VGTRDLSLYRCSSSDPRRRPFRFSEEQRKFGLLRRRRTGPAHRGRCKRGAEGSGTILAQTRKAATRYKKGRNSTVSPGVMRGGRNRNPPQKNPPRKIIKYRTPTTLLDQTQSPQTPKNPPRPSPTPPTPSSKNPGDTPRSPRQPTARPHKKTSTRRAPTQKPSTSSLQRSHLGEPPRAKKEIAKSNYPPTEKRGDPVR